MSFSMFSARSSAKQIMVRSTLLSLALRVALRASDTTPRKSGRATQFLTVFLNIISIRIVKCKILSFYDVL